MILPTKSGGGVELADYIDTQFVMTSGDRGYFYFPSNHPWSYMQVLSPSGSIAMRRYYIGSGGWTNIGSGTGKLNVKNMAFGFDLMSASGTVSYVIRLYK